MGAISILASIAIIIYQFVKSKSFDEQLSRIGVTLGQMERPVRQITKGKPINEQ